MGSGSGSSGEPNDLYTRSLRDRERIATEAALEAGHVREWGFFIKCYAEGRFNLSNPPDPPPMRPGFRGLPAPKPVGEEERLKVSFSEVVFGSRRGSRRYLQRRVAKMRITVRGCGCR